MCINWHAAGNGCQMTFLSPATLIFFLPQKGGVCGIGKMRLATLLVFRSKIDIRQKVKQAIFS